MRIAGMPASVPLMFGTAKAADKSLIPTYVVNELSIASVALSAASRAAMNAAMQLRMSLLVAASVLLLMTSLLAANKRIRITFVNEIEGSAATVFVDGKVRCELTPKVAGQNSPECSFRVTNQQHSLAIVLSDGRSLTGALSIPSEGGSCMRRIIANRSGPSTVGVCTVAHGPIQ